MKTIAICNHKGGVGKTALSMAIAEGLHRKGKRTLLVDLDQQMNATQQAKIDTTDEVTVYDLLTSFDYTAKDGIKHFDGGDIIPGDVLVSNAESDMAKLDTRLTMLADRRRRAPHRNQPVYRPVQTNRYPTRVRLDRSSSYASSYAS